MPKRSKSQLTSKKGCYADGRRRNQPQQQPPAVEEIAVADARDDPASQVEQGNHVIMDIDIVPNVVAGASTTDESDIRIPDEAVMDGVDVASGNGRERPQEIFPEAANIMVVIQNAHSDSSDDNDRRSPNGLLDQQIASDEEPIAVSPQIDPEPTANQGSPNIQEEVRILREEIENQSQDMELDMYNDVVVVALPIDFNDERRRNQMMDARNQDIVEQGNVQADVDRLRNIAQQAPTYLQATHRRAQIHQFGQMVGECRHCHARFFTSEQTSRGVYTKCCANGQVLLPPQQQFPHELWELFTGQHVLSREFKKNIIVYNNCFQFASVQANMRNLPGRGPYVYAIQGQIYHHYTDVNVNRGHYKCGPLYFLNPEEATHQRLENAVHFNVRPDLMRMLSHILHDVNPFARQYRHLYRVYDDQRRQNPEGPLPRVYLEFIVQRRDPRHRELDPVQVDEVAAVYEYNETRMPNPKMRVFLTNADNQPRTISLENELCDPLSFPLLFPTGQPGWRFDIAFNDDRPGRRRTRVSVCQYYAYLLAHRIGNDADAFNVFRFAGKLMQKFVVCSYLKVESNRMWYLRTHQDQMRAEEYQGLADYVRNVANNQEVPVGRVVVLPSTFTLGPRSQMQRYQDAMAVVNVMGYPSLFITMTCNPKWPEILENIPLNDDPSNHPLLMCRVFQMKLQELMKDLISRQVMGVPIAHLYVIEFQKRGLPHAHILITLRNEDKPLDADRIDQLVCAELPDPETEQALFDLVGTHMIHGPCGAHNPGSVCMQDGSCFRKFPKYWCNNTNVRNGLINYRRRRNGRVVERRVNNNVYYVENDYVVPYNPYLLLKYRTHINVEICTGTGCVKYLYKYFFKDTDRALIRVVEENENPRPVVHDEIQSYLNGRYMTAPEAGWHILSFPFHQMSHHVERLPIHLPGRQQVVFREGEEQVVANDEPTTRLLQWFETNRRDPEARQLLYGEFPLQYVWDNSAKRWKRRQRTPKPVVPRIFNVSIRSGELYYLRLLLLQVRGATSFDDIKTVDGEVCDTFQEACRRRNLLQEDREWIRSLNEAAQRDMPKQMRQMFAYILILATVEDPPALWQQFRRHMMEDFLRRLDEENAENAALSKIQSILLVSGRRLSEFGLPDPPDYNPAQNQQQFNVEEERREGEDMLQRLNVDQRNVYDAVMRAVDDDGEARRLFFVTGPAGSGKTYLYNSIITCLNARNVKVLAVAWTGLAASLLKQGKTLHSTFRLPLRIVENSTSGIKFQSNEAASIREAKLLIFDEVSMTSRLAFDAVEKSLRFLCADERPFGGKCVLVGGDFKQCLPIVIGSDRTNIVQACVKSSPHWQLFEELRLFLNMRVHPEEVEFIAWLDRLGNGTLETPEIPQADRRGIIRVPDRCIVDSIDELIRQVFGQLRPGDVPNKAVLSPLNNWCHEINNKVLDMIVGTPERIYVGADSIVAELETEADNFTMEYLNNLMPSGFPPNRLRLKEGTVVMLLKNLDVRAGLCNGTRLLIRNLCEHYIDAVQLDGAGQLTDKRIFVPRVDFTSESDPTLPFIFRRRQFPLKPAYALTINKAQGQTFDAVGICLMNPVFQHGQLYVAFSRARRFDQVFVYVADTTNQGKLVENSDSLYTRNIVYNEIL